MFISEVEIKNFKSIKELKFETNRINVFIGEPNSGKTNILEALSFFSINALDSAFKDVIRYRNIANLFYDSLLDSPVEVNTDIKKFRLDFAVNNSGAFANYFEGVFYNNDEELQNYRKNRDGSGLYNFTLEHNGNIRSQNVGEKNVMKCATYIFKKIEKFIPSFRPFLNPPFGDNIPNLLISNSTYKNLVSLFFREKGFRINLKPGENDLEIVKEVDEVLYSYPYMTISETLQRLVFLMLAIDSNTDMTLIMDEPESNTFPFYTKFIAEKIAKDISNQYFITTHNPYVLINLIDKTPSKDLSVYVTRMKDYSTEIHKLNSDQIVSAMEYQHDIFFNLDNITG
ncbi:MAG: AAA family ATPase [Bacteroidetes bacterium]|nr:AAA family ATPase [Bacteroidota bacterium]